MENSSYKMDRSKITAQTFKEADDHMGYWQHKTEEERLNAACFIIHQIFGTTPFTKVDRTVFSKRKH